ncbi:MAG: hypothetical protein V5A45_14860 [Haloarculaceae archaeon]
MAGRDSTVGKSIGVTEATTSNDKSDSLPYTEKQLYDALWNIRRRYILYYTKHVGRPVPFEELVEQITIWESFGATDVVDRNKRKSVHNSLNQTHLPKLEQIGLINNDKESNKISATDRAEQIELYPASERHSWVFGYNILSISFIFLFGLDFLGVTSLTAPTSITLLEGLVLFLIILTVGQTYDRMQYQHRLRTKGPDIVVKTKEKNS